jgi:hypothetical protein
MAMKVKNKDSGKLRIGDDWNAIRIIELSQRNRNFWSAAHDHSS